MQQEINILYEDGQIIVCEKPAGIPTQSRDVREKDMVSMLKNHLRQAEPGSGASSAGKSPGLREEPYLATIHRLDKPVRGLLLFAKTPQAAKELNRQLTDHKFRKEYLAMTEGTPPEEEGILEDYLITDHRTNMTSVCQKNTPGARLARLKYQVLKEGQEDFNWGHPEMNPGHPESNLGHPESNLGHPESNPGHPESSWGRGKTSFPPSPTTLHIDLETGRHHQIRVQLAHIGCPVIGDTKYNPDAADGTGLFLCAYKLSFSHPSTHKPMHFHL